MASNEPSPQHEISHPPHVIRLLRLIRQGTPSHASRASALLGRYAAACCSGGVAIKHQNDSNLKSDDKAAENAEVDTSIHPSMIIWDLIGRLVAGDGKVRRKFGKKGENVSSSSSSGLFDFHWTTRSNCALALESVARFLPIEDRRHFFEGGKEDEGTADDESLMWLSVHDLHGKLADDDLDKKPQAKARSETSKSKESEDDTHTKNQMNVVVERGRLLLASSGERFDWTCEDEEVQEYIREQQALQSLDGTATSKPESNQQHATDEGSPQQSFLIRRVKLQRQILAQRLGLGGILSAPIVNTTGNNGKSSLVNGIVKDEEFVSDLVSSDATSSKKRKATKSTGKKGKPVTKRKKSTKASRKKSQDEEDEHLPTIDIRNLLLAECNRSYANSHNITDTRHRSRHRNPQLLLSTEVAYRTFDPQWTVRHGALLATLSLLRAWRVHDLSRSSKQTNPPKATNKAFGRWPHDILARCICIIALDQFADFSGIDLEGVDGTSDDVVSGAIVAPVREMAAQIIAILLEAAPSDVWDCTADLLVQLYNHRSGNERGGWEVRHGVLLVWKYVCVLSRLHSPFQGQTESALKNKIDPTFRPLTRRSTLTKMCDRHDTYDNIIKYSIRGVSDKSDDVRAVAAQVLLQMLRTGNDLHTMDIIKECTTPLWEAIRGIRGVVSSSASDLLALFAAVLSHNCKSTLEHIQEAFSCSNEGQTVAVDMILEKLEIFISFDSSDVQISCFQALCLVVDALKNHNTKMNSLLIEHSKQLLSMTRVLCGLGEKLFYDCCTNTTDQSLVDAVKKHRDLAWCKILDSLADLVNKSGSDGECKQLIKNTAVTLTLRYFDILKQSVQMAEKPAFMIAFRESNRNPNEFVRAGSSYSNNSFFSKIISSLALAQFYKRVCSNDMHSFISVAVLTMLQSPWLSQCEASCLLHIAIASLYSDEPSLEHRPFFLDHLSHLTALSNPLSILMENSHPNNSVLCDHQVQSLCDGALATLLAAALDATDSENALVDNLNNLRKSLLQERGVSVEALQQSTPATTKSSMRLHASVSGAIIHCGGKYLPDKITPIIRSLMTSLQSEDSDCRAKQTCSYLARLVASLSDNSSNHKARDKLLENICSLACSPNAYAGSNSDVTPSCFWAQQTLKTLVADMNEQDTLQDFPAIFERLSMLVDPDPSLSEQQQFDSIVMFHVVSGALTAEHQLFSAFVSSFANSIVHTACYNRYELVRKQASESLKSLCKTNSTIGIVITALVPILSDLQNNEGRKGGCELLAAILQVSSDSVSLYVITLLPIVMRLMTDVSEECSRHAACAFAILVRVAPLSASCIDNNNDAAQTNAEPTGKVSDDVIKHLILGKPLPPCEIPSSITLALQQSGTVLRPYQVEGISWIKFLSDVNLNGALCDDMGLGKTLQSLVGVALSHCSNESGSKRSLVVCPSSVTGKSQDGWLLCNFTCILTLAFLTNQGHWVSEIRRFFPGSQVLSPFDFTGPAKLRRRRWKDDAHHHNIVVTSYSVLRADVDLLEQVLWNYCILDEGHLLKNPKTITAKASRKIKARHKLILTGTPIQNNAYELWTTFDFLLPNFLGTESTFLKDFARPISNGQQLDASAADINRGMECLKILHQQVLPFVLRREKSQVMKELPPKIVTDIPCAMSYQQQLVYDRVTEEAETKTALQQVDISIKSAEDENTQSGPTKGSGAFASLLQLRLICTHPILNSLFAPKKNAALPLALTRLDSSGKLVALNDLLRHSGIAGPEITAADNDSSGLLASDDLSSCDGEDGIFGDENCIDDVDQDAQPDDSVSMMQSKCLIFAQFTQSLDIVERFLFEPHMPSLEYLRLDGSVPSNQRSAIVDRFNTDVNVKVLLLTTKVGGLGLNLIGADKVILLEPDWNPFVDLQAMDRAHRIGQTKTVNIYRLVTTNTIEEKIMALQQRKKNTANAVVNTDNSTMYSMGTDRLLDIFTFQGSNESPDGSYGDNVLSYLDANSKEYASLSADSFLRGLN